MTTHTKGPWEIKTVNNTRVQGARHIFAAGWPGKLICEGAYGATLEESDANARLIAAAPDLLAALADCLVWLAQDDSDSGRAYAQRARAAIEKATKP